MKRFCTGLFVLLLISMPLWSLGQKVSVKKIDVSWKVLENATKGQPHTRAALTIVNRAGKPLPREGWSLYFNYSRYINTTKTKGGLLIEHVNGDLYRVFPPKDGRPVGRVEAARVEWLVPGPVMNYNDAPAGLYWVWDDKPEAGIAISNYALTPPDESTEGDVSRSEDRFMSRNERVFWQNETITDIPENGMVKIFPMPFAYEERSGLFMITEGTWIETDQDFEEVGEYLAEELFFILGTKPVLNPGSGDERNKILLRKSDTKPEAYTLSVNPARIEITSSSAAGIFYGIQSLKTLIIPSTLRTIQRFTAIPSVEVMDGPRFSHRALMLDVARNFHSKQQVMKVIDLMALYKLNVLHLHLSDDEGWRLEIPDLPELTEIGGRRGHNLDGTRYLQPSYGSGPGWDNPRGNGYFTRDDFIDILQYAKLHFVTVIPGIGMPGHARAAIISMNYRYHRLMENGEGREAAQFLLRDPDDQSIYIARNGWKDNVMDPGLPSTFRFIEKVVDEIVDMYKDAEVSIASIHVGGDDVPAEALTGSPAATLLLKGDPDIRDARDVKRYFFNRIDRILKAKGLPLYAWQEVGTRQRLQQTEPVVSPDPELAHRDVIVDLVNNASHDGRGDLAFRMANAGYKVVLAPSPEFSFSTPYDPAFDEHGKYAGISIDIDKPFGFKPYGQMVTHEPAGTITLVENPAEGPESLTEYGRQNIIGVKGLLWSEALTNSDELEYMLLPRLFALAQRAWSRDPVWDSESDPQKSREMFIADWSHFVNVLGKRELPRLDVYSGGYAYRIPAPGLRAHSGMVSANTQFPGLLLRYTIDGREPTLRSELYTGPVPAVGIVKVRAFNSMGRGGHTATWSNPLSLPEYGPEDQDEDDSAYTHK